MADTAPDNPVDVLADAATKLRSICTAACPGPWTIAKIPPFTDPVILSRYEETPEDGEVVIVGNIDVEREDQAVIQTLNPAVGLALAVVLQGAADTWATNPEAHPADEHEQALLDLAHHLIGSEN